MLNRELISKAQIPEVDHAAIANSIFQTRPPELRRSPSEIFDQFLGAASGDVPLPSREQLSRALPLLSNIEAKLAQLSDFSDRELGVQLRKVRQWPCKNNPEFTVEFFSLASEALRRHHRGFAPNQTQLMTLLLLVDPENRRKDTPTENGQLPFFKGLYAQVGTGEGKSALIAMLAAFSAYQGVKVHVLPPSYQLGVRDVEDFSAWFSALDLKTQAFRKGSLNPAADIVYSTAADLIRYDFNRRLNGNARLALGRPTIAICDENDNLLFDKSVEEVRLAVASQVPLSRTLLQDIMCFVNEKGREAIERDPLSAAKDFNKLQGSSVKSSMLQTLTLLESAIVSQSLELNSEYTIESGKIKIVDVDNTGRLLHGMSWSDGVHEFLCLRHNLPFPQRGEPLAVRGYDQLVSTYQQLFCLSGTIGDRSELDEMGKVHNVRGFYIPAHQASQRIDHGMRIFSDIDAWSEQLTSQIKALQRVTPAAPALLLVSSISQAAALHARFCELGLTCQLLTDSKNLDVSGRAASEQKILAQAGQAGTVTISTVVAGRGADIRLSAEAAAAGGLKTFLCCLLNKRGENQGRGRSGRQGQPGETYLSVCLSEDRFLRSQLPEVQEALQTMIAKVGEEDSAVSASIKFLQRFDSILDALDRGKRRILGEQVSIAQEFFFNKLASTEVSAKSDLARKNKIARIWSKGFGEYYSELSHQHLFSPRVDSTKNKLPAIIDVLSVLETAFELSYGCKPLQLKSNVSAEAGRIFNVCVEYAKSRQKQIAEFDFQGATQKRVALIKTFDAICSQSAKS